MQINSKHSNNSIFKIWFYLFPAKEIMAAFTRMSASFNENMRKMKASKKSGAGTSQVYVPSFRHFDEMTFLVTTNLPRKGVSSAAMSTVLELDSDQENFDFNNPSFKKRKKAESASASKGKNNSIHADFFEKASATISAIETNTKMMSDEITGVCTLIDAELRKLPETERKEKIRQHLALHY